MRTFRLPRWIASLLAVVAVILVIRPTAAQGLVPFEQQVFDLVNQQRVAHRLAPLRLDWRLVEAARRHIQQMIKQGQLSHQVSGERPLCAGGPNDDRFDEVGYRWRMCGENIGAGHTSPQQIVDAWMNSAGHRANILNADFVDTGVGYGTGGSYGHWWAQVFARPDGDNPPPPPPPPTPQPSLTWMAEYNINAAPANWLGGQFHAFTVTVRNTGTATWPSRGEKRVRLGLRMVPTNGGAWFRDWRYDLPNDIPPGGTLSVNVNHWTPITTQSLTYTAQMVKEGEFWFAQTASRPAHVWAVEYDLSQAPGVWRRGQSQTFNITLRNVGNMTWNANAPQSVRLSLHFTPSSGGWATHSAWYNDRWFRPPRDVRPGENVTISVNPVAPSSQRGLMFLEASLVKDGAFWFSQSSHRQIQVN